MVLKMFPESSILSKKLNDEPGTLVLFKCRGSGLFYIEKIINIYLKNLHKFEFENQKRKKKYITHDKSSSEKLNTIL